LTKKINIDYSKLESTYEVTSEVTSEEETNLEIQYLTESESTNLESSENESCNKAKEIRQEIRKNNNLNENGERIDGKVLMDYSDKDDVYGSCVQPFVHEACTKYARCTDSHNLKSGCYVQSEDGLVVGCPAKCCKSEPLSEEASPLEDEDSPVEVEDSPVEAEDSPVEVEDSPVEAEDSPVEGFLNYKKWLTPQFGY
tara:strand:+ start:3798 stop:4391 length:594 start_codon:yes stop_codon:yes gene_type:complete